jgi:hypothetical protein
MMGRMCPPSGLKSNGGFNSVKRKESSFGSERRRLEFWDKEGETGNPQDLVIIYCKKEGINLEKLKGGSREGEHT